jgi:hypothetical protein
MVVFILHSKIASYMPTVKPVHSRARLLDMPGGKIPVQDYMRNEARFRMVERIDPERFGDFARRSQLAAERRIATHQHLATLRLPKALQAAVEAGIAANGSAPKTEE